MTRPNSGRPPERKTERRGSGDEGAGESSKARLKHAAVIRPPFPAARQVILETRTRRHPTGSKCAHLQASYSSDGPMMTIQWCTEYEVQK